MVEVPSLVDLCVMALRDELIQGSNNDIFPDIYWLPSELFDNLLLHLPPLALQKLHENVPLDLRDKFEFGDGYRKCGQKRVRCGVFDEKWEALHRIRWPSCDLENEVDARYNRLDETVKDSVIDWQQLYWEAHLQDCIDALTERALLPSYKGSIGEMQIPMHILGRVSGNLIKLPLKYLKFCHHCEKFGIYARNLRLHGALCVEETCNLLIKLESLELLWIKSCDHVKGLCKLFKNNAQTLTSIEFVHCKFTQAFINAICESLFVKGLQTHGIQHYSIKRSSLVRTHPSLLPDGLKKFLRSGTSLCSLIFSDDGMRSDFARMVIDSLSHGLTKISMLDLSENSISGFLSHFQRKLSSVASRVGSFQSLIEFNLRGCSLVEEDIDCLKEALVHMPGLEKLDLSDNSIGNGLASLIPYFTQISSRDTPFIDLKLENCELTFFQMRRLLEVLTTMKKPLHALSIKGNMLGNEIGASLGKFMSSGVRTLNIEDIGLGCSGFEETLGEISKESKLVSINISFNLGGIGAAKFVAKLISDACDISSIITRYNSMPVESLSIIASALKASKGKLHNLDLDGNRLGDATTILSEFQIDGKLLLDLSFQSASVELHDDDP